MSLKNKMSAASNSVLGRRKRKKRRDDDCESNKSRKFQNALQLDKRSEKKILEHFAVSCLAHKFELVEWTKPEDLKLWNMYLWWKKSPLAWKRKHKALDPGPYFAAQAVFTNKSTRDIEERIVALETQNFEQKFQQIAKCHDVLHAKMTKQDLKVSETKAQNSTKFSTKKRSGKSSKKTDGKQFFCVKKITN